MAKRGPSPSKALVAYDLLRISEGRCGKTCRTPERPKGRGRTSVEGGPGGCPDKATPAAPHCWGARVQ